MKKFAVFDIDGTLIRWQLYHAIADTLARRGHIKPASYVAMKNARMAWKKRTGGSFKDYELQVIGVYEAVLKTLNFEQLDEAIDDVFEEYKDQVYTYTRDLITKLKVKEYSLFAISGSQTEIVAKIAEYYGFDDYVGTIYERLDDKFTGSKIIGSRNKNSALDEMVKKHGVSYQKSMGIGDSYSDISMLKLVEHPIAFNPEESLFRHAKTNGWKIVVERKNVIYELNKIGDSYGLA
jgi:HAD superfamily hydrolase (TIGR01490 family)